MLWIFRLLSASAFIACIATRLFSSDQAAELPHWLTVIPIALALAGFGSGIFAILHRAWPEIVYYGIGNPDSANVVWDSIPWRTRIVVPIGGMLLFFWLSQFQIEGFDGTPGHRDGKPVLESHGRIIREINEEEYRRAHNSQIGAFSMIGCVAAWIGVATTWSLPLKRPRG